MSNQKPVIQNAVMPGAIILVLTNMPDQTSAGLLAESLVMQKLAACVNILDNMHSIYRWKEKVQEDSEVVLIAKTTERRVPRLIDTVKSLHSYDCPCIVSFAIEGGNPDFLAWIDGEVGRDPASTP